LSVVNLVQRANNSAAGLVNLLSDFFPCFKDEATFERKNVRFLKRAQIFVADLWAAFGGETFGQFEDIDNITMFADYRVPQKLRSLGALNYSPPLEDVIRKQAKIPPGHSWEIQIRGCSIWCVELIKREIKRRHPESELNAVLLDFYLYDSAKKITVAHQDDLPHHRTRTVCY